MDPSEIRTVSSEAELRKIVKEPPQAIWDKDIARIDEHARTIIAHSPFVLLATANTDGTCDVSPRGDPAGSVVVLDDHRLALADRPGNQRLDSLRNILRNPRAGLLFIVPGMNETLRVNGRATLVSDAPFFDDLSVRGKRPRLAILVEVEELFMHCAKAFLRSSLWKPETWPDRESLPTLGRIAKDQMGIRGVSARMIDAGLALDAKMNQY
ncbi:pyridoxamine 5'-phosphate oxidase-like FMN-binding protein [Acrocarpospora phusangensis]|uniref:Pyridoxamine 5'-phosphate oxidase-like FMN-binding protein n=1 Tax=Acrocarpospora phusangensis TaxID=1070424 RepID=A0A919Q8U2_9ACTN|nr:pyridoxamine 5'-phosphate oxidase family protein [Acrocarpospora phusangensis]GIH23631.1 pyridoxamine 5'-phosphate oxidase-like FMN-binding protein [Acrocarpospora phusangensis]